MFFEVFFFFLKETLWYSGVHVYLPGRTMTDFLLSHNLHNSYNFHYFCHIVSSVCQYWTLCKNIKLNSFEATMSFHTPCQRYLNKLPTQNMEVFNMRSFHVVLAEFLPLMLIQIPNKNDNHKKWRVYCQVSICFLGICPSLKLVMLQSW